MNPKRLTVSEGPGWVSGPTLGEGGEELERIGEFSGKGIAKPGKTHVWASSFQSYFRN